MSTALVPYVGGDATARMDAWTGLPTDERKRRAVRACLDHDADSLIDLALAYRTLTNRGVAGGNPYTRRNYRQAITALLLAWQAQDLLHVTSDNARTWVQHLTTAGARDFYGNPKVKNGRPVGLAPGTVTVYLAGARALYAALRWAKAVDGDPWRDVKAPRDTTAPWDKRAPYDPKDVDALIDHADGDDRALVLLGAHAGLRLAEALALRWDDIDLAAHKLTVWAGKGAKTRRVDVSPRLVAVLGTIKDHGPACIYMQGASRVEYVLPYRSAFTARYRLHALCKRAGVTYRGVHALRHAAGTRMYSQTGRLEDAQRHLGHSNISTTQVYAAWSDERVKTALQGW